MSFLQTLFAAVRRRPFWHECFIFLAFIALTAVMTWPWLRHPLDTVSDLGDPYNIAYTLWWDYYQTFHDPRHLFDATVFYPYRDTLAFSEHDYGIALLFFPLFALGVRPLTVHSLATFFAFVLSGYGAFRLARTLTGSYGAAWIAGVAFAFIPYRFQRLPHLHYIFAGWIPLLFEALVLFVRGRSWRSAGWLGIAFLMNALTCISWFILTLIPLGLSAVFLVAWHRAWRGRALWLRGAVALGAASLALLPFLLPYKRVSAQFQFVRSYEESVNFSATALNWLAASARNKIWSGLGGASATEEVSLFPGLLLPLLAFAALVLFNARARKDEKGGEQSIDEGGGDGDDAERHEEPHSSSNFERSSWLRRFATPARLAPLLLDALALGAGLFAILISAYGTLNLRLFGFNLIDARRPEFAFVVCMAALVARAVLACWPLVRRIAAKRFNRHDVRGRGFETFVHGAIWLSIGFLGSLGTHAFFHRFLFEHFEIFKSQRVPARWSMICYMGLALLAGLGARSLAQLITGWQPRVRQGIIFAVLLLALLFELRVAPLVVTRGEAYPDELTLRLKETPMRGGLVELPALGPAIFSHMIRAADHRKPIVTAASSFLPPIMRRIESLSQHRPVPAAEFLDLLESIPASYLVIHYSYMTPEELTATEPVLRQGLAEGRLRYIRSYQDRGRKDLYAVMKTEPTARSESRIPPELLAESAASKMEFAYMQTELPPAFREDGFWLHRLHKATYGRAARFADFAPDAEAFARGAARESEGRERRLEETKREFIAGWVERDEFKATHAGRSDEAFIAALVAHTGAGLSNAERGMLAGKLTKGLETRADVLLKFVEREEFVRREFNEGFVLMHYLGYLEREPDAGGVAAWLKALNESGDYRVFTRVFTSSIEYRVKPGKL